MRRNLLLTTALVGLAALPSHASVVNFFGEDVEKSGDPGRAFPGHFRHFRDGHFRAFPAFPGISGTVTTMHKPVQSEPAFSQKRTHHLRFVKHQKPPHGAFPRHFREHFRSISGTAFPGQRGLHPYAETQKLGTGNCSLILALQIWFLIAE
jgi:hypothetical protein